MLKHPIYFLCLLCCIAATNLEAQRTDPDLPTSTVEAEDKFNARLLNTNKIQVDPMLPPVDTSTKRQRYEVVDKDIEIAYIPPRIRPLAMRTDDLQKNYNGYARLGGGFPSAFYGEAGYHLNKEEQFRFGIDLKHHSANNTNNVENQRFRYNHIKADGTYFFPQGFAVEAHTGYTSDDVYFYGYNDVNENQGTMFSFDADEVKQTFGTFNLGASIFNGERTAGDFNYRAGFDLYFLGDEFAAQEDGFNLTLEATKWFNEAHPFTVKLITDFTSFSDTMDQTLNNFYLQPSYTFHGDIFQAKVGFNVASHDDDFFFFPDVELSALLEFEAFTIGAFVGADGTLQKNTFQSLSRYNPFISSRIFIENTQYNHYYGGVKGNIQGIDFNGQIGYKNAENLALFQTQGDSIVRFNPVYDTVGIFTITASAVAPLFKGFEVTGTLTQNFYDPENNDEAWGLPATIINLGARYKTLENTLLVKGDLFVENGVPFFNTLRDETGTLNGLFDISVGVEYYFSENFGLFGSINNLASNKRQRWEHYPTFGLNALFGLSARF